jgi:hypothetical protein
MIIKHIHMIHLSIPSLAQVRLKSIMLMSG